MSNYNTVVVNLLIALQRNLDKPILDKMSFVGANTGNLMFTEGMKQRLDYKKEIWLNAAALKDVENPSVMIPSANFIIAGKNDSLMESVIRFLEATDCPVTMAGLGAQAGINQSAAELVAQLSETKKRALKMLSERATSIGVRGEFTAECLHLLGINNVRVIGCPSFYFRDPAKSYSLRIPSLKRTQITLTPGNIYESVLLETGRSLNSFWMMQMATEFPNYAFERAAYEAEWEEELKKAFPECKMSGEEIWNYMRERAKIFFTLQEWNDFYAKEDITLAYGSRFHGNMAAFRNGVPALWVIHDMRTAELVNTLHLPHITSATMAGLTEPEQLLRFCDYSEYEKHYEGLYLNYQDFLTENGLTVKPF